MSTVTMALDLPVVGSLNFVWERKIKNTKSTLKDWVKLTQNNPISERKEALEKLENVQLEMEESEITLAFVEKEKKS